MISALLLICLPALADPLLIGVGVRQVFREEARLDALTFSVAPTRGPWSLELAGAAGLSALEPSSVERALAGVARDRGAEEFEPEISLDRASLSLSALWSPPLPLSGSGWQGGPRARLGVEGRMLATAHLTQDEAAGEAITGLEGWSLVDDGPIFGLGPVLGLGFSLSPTPRAALRLEAADRMLALSERLPQTLDSDATGFRHDWTLGLDLALALGGGR